MCARVRSDTSPGNMGKLQQKANRGVIRSTGWYYVRHSFCVNASPEKGCVNESQDKRKWQATQNGLWLTVVLIFSCFFRYIYIPFFYLSASNLIISKSLRLRYRRLQLESSGIRETKFTILSPYYTRIYFTHSLQSQRESFRRQPVIINSRTVSEQSAFMSSKTK